MRVATEEFIVGGLLREDRRVFRDEWSGRAVSNASCITSAKPFNARAPGRLFSGIRYCDDAEQPGTCPRGDT